MLPPPYWQNVAALLVAVLLWRFLVHFNRRSALDDIRGPGGGTFLGGHISSMFDITHGLKAIERLSDEYGGVIKVKGPMASDRLWISDPRALEHMLLRASTVYHRSSSFSELMRILFGPGLLATTGEQHKRQRRLLNPLFSRSHISNLVPLFYEIGHKLKDKLLEDIGSESKEIDLLDWMGRTTMEFIGQGGLGHQFGALEGLQNEYRDAQRLLLPTLARSGLFGRLGPLFSRFGPAWFRRLVVKVFPVSAIRQLQQITDVLHQTSTTVFEDRKQLLSRGDTTTHDELAGGKDILSVMLRSNLHVSNADVLSDEETIAQLSTLIFAANDTTSGALARVFEMLASHPNIQSELREELKHANADMGLDYEKLMSLSLLDAVCKETLRLHPPITTIRCTPNHDDVVPLLHPIQSNRGLPISEILIPKGTTVWIGISTANQSTSIWGHDAREWVPERWLTSGPVANERLPGAYSSMMTFLGGERACIGYRMAVLEIKVVLSILLPTFRFDPASCPVVWRFGATLAPFVKGREGEPDRGPEMPMRLSGLGNS